MAQSGFAGWRLRWGRHRTASAPAPSPVTASRSMVLPLLLLLLLLLVAAPSAHAAMTFTTPNVQQASLYQTVQLNLRSNPLLADPSITTGDLVTFVPSASTALCVHSGTATSSTAGYYAVTAIGSGGYAGQLVFAVTAAFFTAGTTYYPCYLSASAQSATIVRREFVATNQSDALTVWTAVYQSFSMSPTSASGGEGPISLAIQQTQQSGRALNQGLSGSYTVLLVSCGSSTVGGTTVQSNCTSLDALVTACAAVGAASSAASTPSSSTVIALSSLQGQAAGNVSGAFVVPYVPNTSGYYLCVPYCYSTSAGCGGTTTAMSYTVVMAASSTNATYTLAFGSADPGVYTRTPSAPQAREDGVVVFTGTGLGTADDVKVIRSTDSCTSSTATILPDLEVGVVQVTSGTVQVTFLAPNLITAQVVGRVCYRRATSGLWSTAYLSAANPTADFTVDVLQPTGFTIVSPTTTPAVGETITLTFQGTGLGGSVDAAYLSASTETNPCSRDNSTATSSTSSTSSSTYFTCTMSGSSTTTSTCVVMVDPETTNVAMSLSVCYRKGTATAQQTNFAAISGTVALLSRNPTYTVTPYPTFAGQSVQLVFSGVGLSANDAVQLIAPGSTCGNSSATLTTATITGVTELSPGTSYAYTLVGIAETCIMICYRQVGSASWVVARGGDGRPEVSTSCAASNIYIAAFPVRYAITNLASTGMQLSVGETGTLRFTAVSGQSFTSLTTPTAVMLVQAPDSCVTAPCGTALQAACAGSQAATDYTSSVVGSGSVAYSASIYAGTAEVRYIVCVETSSGGSSAYVPVLPLTELSATSTAFGFTTALQNPTLVSHTPSTWRVGMNTLTSTFSGTGLDASTNVVYAVAASTLLAAYTTSSGALVAVCPPVSQTPATVLVSSMVTASSSTTSTTASYTRADQLYTGASVYLCYAWSSGSGDAHVTMAGLVNVSAAIPSSFSWTTPTTTTGLRAGQAVVLNFVSNLTSLSATGDAVYFYRFITSANPNPNCYCDPTACAPGTRVSYAANTTLTSATTGSITDDTTVYTAPLGFDNYDYSAVYVICYAAAGQSADTYMGRVTVDLANPTYYTLSSVAGSLNRVGAPLTITAVRRCLTTACALSLGDSLRLIPSDVQCAQLALPTSGGNSSDAVEDAYVEAIGDPVLGAGAISLARAFVVDVVGTYRVCYLISGGTAYGDVVFSASYVRSVLSVTSANPLQATPTPSAPSAGQFVTINISCTTTTLCATCTTVRLVPGSRASCWASVTGTYSSDSCLTTTVVQYPNQYFAAGAYTVCYGSSYTTSRRIPGVLTVTAANPSIFVPTTASGYSVYTNQGTNYTLNITGTQLSVSDTVFLLPNMGYTCHDLRTGEVQSDGQLASWLAPSVAPYPLQLITEGVSWVVSNQGKRFGIGVLNDTDLCPGDEAPCAMKLCYLRAGTSWAPVTLQTSTTASSASSEVYLVASNPSAVEFDRYPLFVDMYVMATVQGAGLESTDVVAIHAGDCSGAAVTVAVSGASFVNAAGTQWQGVLRATAAASSYAVCYWRSGSATEVATISFAGEAADVTTIVIISTPLYYMLSPSNFTSATTALTQYEQLIVGGSFRAEGTPGTSLSYVQLITANTSVAECNYAPFTAAAAAASATGIKTFPIVLTLSAVTSSSGSTLPLYQGRLNIATGAYALCMDATAGLFRVISTPPDADGASLSPGGSGTSASNVTSLVVYDAVPATYVVVPDSVMVGQVATLTFTRAVSSTTSDPYPAPESVGLAAGDTVTLIDGGLYECGFANATVLATDIASAVPGSGGTGTATSTTVSLGLPTTIDEGGTAVAVGGKSYTVCYGKQTATFATSPHTGSSTVDRNLYIMTQVPTQWTSVPAQAQTQAPLNITFYGNTTEAAYLTAADVAFLVSVSAGTTPPLHLCADAASDASSSNSSADRIVIRAGTMTKPGTVNTQWAIPAGQLIEGTYVVCYTSEKNGMPVYVSSPATLEVYATQSPSGAYLARDAASLVNNLDVLQGERVFLMFNTTVALNPQLNNTGDSASPSVTNTAYDEVRITTDSACTAALGVGVVDAIPDSFGYAALGVVDPVTGLTVPYLHLRIRASVGSYYVCMRRKNRESSQAYYNFEVVGGLYVNPAVLEVAAAAVASFTTTPTKPRVWVPHTVVTATYGTGFSVSNMVQFFFVAFTGSGSVTGSNEIDGDACYLPLTSSQASSSSVTLVNTTLQVYLTTPMFTQYSFGVPATYLLCYQTSGRNVASVYPTALTVANPSPITYAVPSALAIQNSFTMSFAAIDAIFATGNSNTAQIYVASDATSVPNCTGATPPTSGTTHFTSFTATNTTYASVEPRLLAAGYFFVCFLTYDQAQYFPVANIAGGYVFSVGMTGAQSYTVAPSPAYLGQLLHLTITGSQLTSSDHVKIVRVWKSELSGSGSETSSGVSYTSACTASAANADASEAAGAAGSAVHSVNGIVANYYPRVNETGTFVLCYQSAALANAWIWVTDINQFTVGPAHPTHYGLSVTPPYETEVLQLYVYDTGDSGGTSAGRLQSTDALKLVTRGSGASGFDCTASATNSTAVGLVTYMAAVSNSSVHVYQICGSAVATVTVCYALAGWATVANGGTPSWAEVPLQSPPSTYVYAGVAITANPFTGPINNGSSSSATWVAPRPYEPFTFYFTSQVSTMAVQRVAFARAPVTVCAVAVAYVTPLYYTQETAVANGFTVSLPYAGAYALYLGPYSTAASPNITHGTTLTVGTCDPCTFTPSYALVGGYVLMAFPSSVGGTLSTADEVRLFPVSQGLTGRPCDAVTGAYAGVTFTALAAESTSDRAVFNVTTGTTAQASTYLGEYYVCYRKVPSSSSAAVPSEFAVVAENSGTASIFSIYPADLLTATACPASPVYALETAVFNVTARNTTLYPNVAFSAADELLLVPLGSRGSGSTGSSSAGADCAAVGSAAASFVAATGERALLATLDSYGPGASNWFLTFPSQAATVQYSWCFKMQYDTVFRNISDALQTVQMEDPYDVATSPPVILPDSTSVQIQITGTGLLATDNVYIVEAAESCAETCDRPLTPTEWSGAAHTVQHVNSTTVLVVFSQSINTIISLGVCYRRTGRYLTRLTNIYVGEPNPISYTVNFVPRVGTRPTLTFTGVNLTSTDAMMIVQPTATCLVRNAIAVGTFLSINNGATTTQFLLALVGSAVLAQNYTVCYEVSTVGAYVEVAPELPVLEGGPSSVTSSNTPMRGRATVLSVADPQAGDEMFIACVGCSCFDLTEAIVPYGSVRATANVTMALRVGFNDTQSYPICYRRSDSGYAQVGGLTYFVTPVTNSPSTVAQLPNGAQYQGQRLHYNVSNYSTAVPLGGNDLVMLVHASRACWDNLDISTSGIVVSTSALTGTVPTAPEIGEWAAHVPSLGPDTPASTLFPLSYLLCYRQAAQLEYVSVPYVMESTTLAAADPATFTTQPASVQSGMLQVNMTFTYVAAGQSGDEAYVVQFPTLTDTVCDDAASAVVAARASAYPVYTFSLSGSAVPGTSNTAVCYVRAGATVAEVPQLLTVTAGNPSGYVTDVSSGATALERQYIAVTVLGTGLSTASDAVVFTDVPCASAPQPFTSTSYLARLSDATSNGTAYTVVAQFVAASSPLDIYVCYRHSNVWREVGAALTLNAPQPSTVTVITSGGTTSTPRAGQHLSLGLVNAPASTPTGAAILSGATNGSGTWCHNFTASDVQEPSLVIWSAALLDIPVWEVAGDARVCVLANATTPWADVATTVDAAAIYINPANPSSMDVFPSPPRVGQSVTLTLHLLVTANAADVVKITTVDYVSCEVAATIPGFAATMPVTVQDNVTTTVTLVDKTDVFAWRSFNATGAYRVCYHSAVELSWGVVGGTLAAGTVTVQEMVPQTWAIASGTALIGEPFALAFYDALGVLHPSTGEDLVWAAPSTTSCGQDPYTCTGCVLFDWNTAASNATVAVTLANVSVRVDNMNLCYQLANATAALVPGSLNVTTGPVQCVENASFISGQTQLVTFRLEEGTNVTDDAWRLSFYATTSLNCDERYVGDFVPGSAQLQSTTSTSATYSVVWPVGLGVTTDRYTICFTHNGVVSTVCTCGQIDARTGECYITGTPGSPQSFTPAPQPTYVGQTISLTFTVNESMTAYPPTAVKFVTYVNPLSSCNAAPAFTPSSATLTRVSAVEYVYAFKHDYSLGSATLMVCALTDLSTSYGRVASTVVPSSPTTNNTLWVRPYLALSTFPSAAAYLSAMQTLNLTFTMASQQQDDLVSAADRITVVSDPRNCVESFIEAQDPATVMQAFYIPDTAFLTLPAPVLAAYPAAFDSTSLATFADNASGRGTHYFCYLLAGATWAPVLPALTITAGLIDSCSVTGAVSPPNGDAGRSTTAPTNNGGSLRAMYYAPTRILGTAAFGSLAVGGVDAVRVVPQSSWCTNDATAVFTGTVADYAGSAAAPSSNNSVEAVFFAPLAGTFKLCYRFANASTTNWSPACTGLAVTAPTPTGATVGCWNVGQAMSITAQQALSGYVFTATDRLRLVQGALPCLNANGSLTASAATVTVDDAAQPTYGITMSTVTTGQTSYAMAPAFFRAGTSAVRLCYTDAAGNQFAVPMNYAASPAVSSFPVQARQPTALTLPQQHIQVGQRLFLNFTAAPATVTPPLDPYAALPSPYVPGPAFNGSYDAATLLAVSSSTAYADGRCAVALRAGTLTSAAFRGVYGSAISGYVPYTIGNYDPTAAQYYITCYQLAACGVVDSGDPLQVRNANPANVYTDVSPPRRGQLFDVLFQRDTTTSDAAVLTPGSDRASKSANLASCWTLSATAGQTVLGTSDLTYFTTIFYAQAPALAANTTTRSCYYLAGGSWSEVPNGVATVLPANPASFDTVPAAARVSQVNYIRFYGTGLGSGDSVKLIALSLNCSAAAVPPTTFQAYTSSSPTTGVTGTAQGWTVTEVSGDGTTASLNFTASATGTFSVCYRLAADTVWTLVYADLTIYERNPSAVVRTPVATLEGELFTLNFTASTQASSGLSANDRIILYYGASVNCLAPTSEQTAPSVQADPSRTDTLPQYIAYQLAAGTRGSYTLCYLMAASTVSGGFITVWGYDVVVVGANPENMTLYPVRTSQVHRPYELLTLVFEGWGLVATEAKTDAVKLIQAGNSAASSASVTDAMCQQTAAVTSTITYYPLYANGTAAEQVWRVTSAGVNVPYAVCYKLSGGQYHAIGAPITITGTASPSGATSTKLAGTAGATTTISVGESMTWALTGATAESCGNGAALLFFSVQGCNDVRYYENVTAILASSALTSLTFPAGAATVTNCSGATQLRVPTSFTFASSSPASGADATLSLCYWSAGNAAVSVLSDSRITLTEGVPPPLTTTLAVDAQAVFSFNLSVSPTTTDWVVLVADASACLGVSAPANAAYFTNLSYSSSAGVATVTAAVPAAGSYYACYSHQDGACAASTGRECARVVAAIDAAAASPSAWAAQPTPLYVSTASLVVTLTFASSSDAAAQGKTAVAWLASVSSATMQDVWLACAQTRATPTAARVNLTYGGMAWTTAGLPLTQSGSYALCYTATSNAADALHLFGPASAAGPVVLPSAVTGVTLPPFVTVGTTNTIVLAGGGLSTTDAVVAVAVPILSSSSGPSSTSSGLPADMCTNTAYAPRVVATNPSSTTAATGLSSMARDLVFSATGAYVLCYTATYGGTPTLITAAPFTVSPSVVSMTVLSPVVEVGVVLELMFSGSGLTATDLAAVVYTGGLTTTPTVENVCLSAAATYTAVTSATADGSTSYYSTTPMQQGTHMVCYRKSQTSTPILLPTKLNVVVRTAASAIFSVQPGGCATLLTCTVQPTVTLVNSSGQATAAPYSTVSMALYNSDGTTAAPDGYLSGGTAYTSVDFTNFTFWALRISTAGTYVMKATVTLGGSAATLVATSAAITVTDGGSTVVNVASVACLPVGILDRTTGSTADTVDCLVTTLISDAPDSFTVQLNAGTATAVTQNGTTSAGLPTYHFIVTAPAASSATAGLVNYLAIVVAPSPPYAAWPVQNSPVTVRLATSPGPQTSLTCSAGSTSLPQSNMVRVGGTLSCGVQGILKVGSEVRNIVAPPQDLRVIEYYNANTGTTQTINLGAYPLDVNGLYSFTVTPSTGLNITVAGTVYASEADTVSGTTAASVWSPMVNSPQTFVLVGVPTAAASTLACVSLRTGSALWYTPAEPLACTAALANAQGQVIGVQGDYTVVLPNGGSVGAVNSSTWGPSLVWDISAPPQSPSPTAAAALLSAPAAPALSPPQPQRVAVRELAAAALVSFAVQVQYTPSSLALASYTGGLVYVTSAVDPLPTLTIGATASLTVAGVGLVTTHRYALGAPANCSQVLAETTPTAGSVVGQLVLTFQVPSTVFVLCFAPDDARAALQTLLTTEWTPKSGGDSNRWSGDDLVLLIIGVVFLFILLVLLLILLWCIFCSRAEDEEGGSSDVTVREKHVTRSTTHTTMGGGHVYMPPRANNRYILRPGTSPSPATAAAALPSPQPQPQPLPQPVPLPIEHSTTPPATPPLSPAPQPQPQPQQPSSNTQIRINIHDNAAAGSNPMSSPRQQQSTSAPAPPPFSSSSGSTSVSSDAVGGGAAGPATLRRRHNRPRRADKSRAYTDLDRDARAPQQQPPESDSLTDTSGVASRRSAPPLPPPPAAAARTSSPPVTRTPAPPSVPAAAVASALTPRPAPVAESAANMAISLPPLPPAPPQPTATATTVGAVAIVPPTPAPTSSGPYQHLHHTTSSQRSASEHGSTDDAAGGPMMVAGHTSKPMVRSASSSRRS